MFVAARPVAAARHGVRLAVDGLACSWALMIAMLAVGVGGLWWMAALAGLMAYETIGHHGAQPAEVAGRLLIGAAGVVLLTGWLPLPAS